MNPSPIALSVLLLTHSAGASAQGTEPPPGTIIYPPIVFSQSMPLAQAPYALDGDDRRVIVGNLDYSRSDATNDSAFVFDRLTAEELFVFTATDPANSRTFAEAVAIWNELAFASGQAAGSDGRIRGYVDVFDLNTGERVDTLRGPMLDQNDRFGVFLAIGGDRIAIGDPLINYTTTNSGRIYVYSLPDLSLLYEISETNAIDASFPLELEMSDNHIIAISGIPMGNGNTEATFLVYDAATGTKLAGANPVVDGETMTRFFGDIAVSDRYALASDINNSRVGPFAGEVYVFDLQQMAFVNSLTPPPGSQSWSMGSGIGVHGDIAAVASPQCYFCNEDQGLIDIVSLPTGTILRTIEAYPWPDHDSFSEVRRFGSSVEIVAAGILVSSYYNFEYEGRVDWIPLPEMCRPDTDLDGILSPADFSAWIAAFNINALECDQNGDGICSPADFSAWVTNFNTGC